VGEPLDGACRGAALDYVEELTRSNVDDLGRPLLPSLSTEAAAQGLVETQRAEPVAVSNEHLPVGGNRVHHRTPAAAEV
jgi:hypothetical protein